jgi:hypothetical protein
LRVHYSDCILRNLISDYQKYEGLAIKMGRHKLPSLIILYILNIV